MGIWAEIKYALNSTLGTSSFKPLNTLITDFITSKTTTITDHVTNERKTITDHVTAKVSDCETNVKKAVSSSETSIQQLITSETSDVELHVTSQTNTVKSRLEEMKFQPMRVITATTTFTPEKTGKYKVICVGKGGNGSSYASVTSVGGGAGGVSIKTLELSSATNYSITISTTASFSNILSAVGGGDASGTTVGTGGTASGGDYNYIGGSGEKVEVSHTSGKGGSVGVYISELTRSINTVIPNISTSNDVIIGWYGDSILKYGAGAPGSMSMSGRGDSVSGLPACVIIIPLA